MSGHGFHVHGPHDHAVEHAAHSGDTFSNNIAVMTAILATVGALFGYLAGATQSDAAMFKNNEAIDKTEAANAWNYYQAKSSKQNLAEMAMILPGVNTAKYESEVARYETEKGVIKKKAEKFEASSKEWGRKSDKVMHQHHTWAAAMTVEQIAISLAAITLLTRKRWLMIGAYAVAAVGIALGAFAWFHIDPIGALLGTAATAAH